MEVKKSQEAANMTTITTAFSPTKPELTKDFVIGKTTAPAAELVKIAVKIAVVT